MSDQTEVFYEKFKGYPVIAIWKIDNRGKKLGERPLLSFGLKKAETILKHLDEIDEFVTDNKGQEGQE